MRFPLCVGRMCDGTMFSSVCALPSPASAEGFPSLFGWFTGTTAQSDFFCTFMSAVRFMAFADRPRSCDQGVQEISRFSCMLFLSVPGSQTTQDRTTTRDNVVAVLPSSLPERSRHPDPSAFRSSIARPTDTSVYASSRTSRCRLQDSSPGWIRCFPFLQGSFIPYNMPVYPRALRVADHSSTIVGIHGAPMLHELRVATCNRSPYTATDT